MRILFSEKLNSEWDVWGIKEFIEMEMKFIKIHEPGIDILSLHG